MHIRTDKKNWVQNNHVLRDLKKPDNLGLSGHAYTGTHHGFCAALLLGPREPGRTTGSGDAGSFGLLTADCLVTLGGERKLTTSA